MNATILLLCIILLQIVDNGVAIRWLSLQHSKLHWNLTINSPISSTTTTRGIRSARSPCTIARKRYGLAKSQAKLCRTSMDAMPHVQKAAVLAADTCQNIFIERRWNCSSITQAPHLTPDLTRATREQAYVYAISSAALTFTMARACATGSLYQCTCAAKPDENPNAKFQWGGCGDNLSWGIYFSKKFIDNVEKSNANRTWKKRREEKNNKILARNEIALVNLHNNKVGRKLVKESLQIQCKCHGVSGSCNIKTCWRGLPPMSEIGKKILERYTNALEITQYNDNLLNKHKRISDQLLFMSKSPDYCTKDDKLGSFGTVGRRCNVTTTGPNSCRQLCCGRGYRTLVEEKIERCQCRYYNCCYVKCNICRTMTQIYECG